MSEGRGGLDTKTLFKVSQKFLNFLVKQSEETMENIEERSYFSEQKLGLFFQR